MEDRELNQAAQEMDSKDAARYRWLRDSSDKALWDGLMQTLPFAHLEFDRKIDAAIASQAKKDAAEIGKQVS